MTQALDSYRYPGSHPFQDTDLDRLLFRGRESEANALLHLILSERLVVLFGKSGMGKTSLLNAGVFHDLRARGFLPVPVRFHDPRRSPVEQLLQQVGAVAEGGASDGNLEDDGTGRATLWQFFKQAEFWSSDDRLMSPVLVLDQFEELFVSFHEDQRKAFAVQLADLIRGQMPEELRIARGDSKGPLDETAPDVRIVISLREDYLAYLDELADVIPGILRSRYRLVPLRRDQARIAIEEPALVESQEIQIPAFAYAPRAVEAIIGFLARQGAGARARTRDEVEPFQLQLLCKHVERTIVARSPQESGTIQVYNGEDLGGERGMRQIMQNFYDDQVAQVPRRYRGNVRRLCERRLVQKPGKRVSLPKELIESSFHVPRQVLSNLVNLRLLRLETRGGTDYYELSHDTLVEPILDSAGRHRARRRALYFLPIVLLMVAAGGYLLRPPAGWQYHEQEGHRQLAAGKSMEALRHFEAAMVHGGRSPALVAAVGDAHLAQRSYDEAIDHYNEAARRDSIFGGRLVEAARALDDSGKRRTAQMFYAEALERFPRDADLRNDVGVLLFALKDTAAADSAFRHSIELDSTYALAHGNLSAVLTLLGRDSATAAAHRRRELELAPVIAVRRPHECSERLTAEEAKRSRVCLLRSRDVAGTGATRIRSGRGNESRRLRSKTLLAPPAF